MLSVQEEEIPRRMQGNVKMTRIRRHGESFEKRGRILKKRPFFGTPWFHFPLLTIKTPNATFLVCINQIEMEKPPFPQKHV
jgi:hypothetical protein